MRWILLSSLFLPFSVQAVRITADFSSAKDTATCDWNTNLGKIRAPQESNGVALDYGDGSDGDCNFSGTVAAGTYDCRTLTISSTARFTGTVPVVIRVQGNVTISGTLSVDGFAGNIGNQTTPAVVVTAGGVSGPGGFDGGDFDSANFPYALAGDQNATGAGAGGDVASSAGSEFAGGGGGAGGNFGDITLATNGSNGTVDGVGSFPGNGGATSAVEAASDEDGFETLLIGGAGGGAGGMGDENASTILYYGGSGGGGGGILHLIAGGNITVTGIISANGGRGGNATQLGGAGGGGAGGVIWLQTGGNIINNGTIRALGGAGGTVTSSLAAAGGNGGSGGDGRIRLDDIDGVISGNAPTPVAQISNNNPGIYDVGYQVAACTALTTSLDTIGIINKFKSATASQVLNGGTLNVQIQDSADGTTWGALVPLNQISTLTRRYLRLDISLTPASAASSPELDAIAIEYDITDKSDVEFKSDVSCGSIDLGNNNQGGGAGMTLILGLMIAIMIFRPIRN
jgi:hypothetical protein